MANGPGFNVAALDPLEGESSQSAESALIPAHQNAAALATNLSATSSITPLKSFAAGAESPGFTFGVPADNTWIIEGSTRGTATSTVGNDQVSSDLAQLRLRSRSGRLQLAEDGSQRYFGATSNLHLIHNGPYSSFNPHLKVVHAEGLNVVKSIGMEWPGDLSYEQHLRECYFTWANPLTNVIDRDLFERAMNDSLPFEDIVLYSPALDNAM